MTNVFDFLTFNNDPNLLLTGVILPFVLIFAIIWGVLNMTRIFGNDHFARKINMVVAIVITFFTAFTDAWGLIATQLAAFSGVFVVVIFFALFIISAIMWAIGRGRDVYDTSDMGNVRKRFQSKKKIDKELDKLYRKLERAKIRGDENMAKEYSHDIFELRRRKDELNY